ncbi:hypothetical protein BJ742DRAFT_231701 [Cladochytrium replicatum]|nr:hypothetical protein BJ742DRAFT_231701 [Cladochytrium replicatum]
MFEYFELNPHITRKRRRFLQLRCCRLPPPRERLVKSSRACMCQNVTTDRLLGVGNKAHCSSGVSAHLIGYEHRNIERLSDLHELRKHDAQFLLSIRELTATGEVSAEECDDGVNNEEAIIFLSSKDCGEDVEKFVLVLRVVGSGHGDVLESGFGINAEAICNCFDTFGSEGALRVDESSLENHMEIQPQANRRRANVPCLLHHPCFEVAGQLRRACDSFGFFQFGTEETYQHQDMIGTIKPL